MSELVKVIFPCGAYYPVRPDALEALKSDEDSHGRLTFSVANTWQGLSQPFTSDTEHAKCWMCSVSQRRGRKEQRVFVCDDHGDTVLGDDGRPLMGFVVSCKAKPE